MDNDTEKLIHQLEDFSRFLKEFGYGGYSLIILTIARLKEQDNEIDNLKTLLFGYEIGAIKGEEIGGSFKNEQDISHESQEEGSSQVE